MKTYGELNLKKIRNKCGLDFAHFTYPLGMCPCCTTIMDFPAKYWREGRRPTFVEPEEAYMKGHYELDGKPVAIDDFSYILFANSNKQGGYAAKGSKIDSVYVACHFKDDEQMKNVLCMLSEQLGNEYVVSIRTNTPVSAVGFEVHYKPDFDVVPVKQQDEADGVRRIFFHEGKEVAVS